MSRTQPNTQVPQQQPGQSGSTGQRERTSLDSTRSKASSLKVVRCRSSWRMPCTTLPAGTSALMYSLHVDAARVQC